MMNSLNQRHPSVEQIRSLLRTLGPLADGMVFIGGAIAPLLQTNASFDSARPTIDVDALVAVESYSAFADLETELRAKGFRQAVSGNTHAFRYLSPFGVPFDLVPAGEHFAGSGQPWELAAIRTALSTSLGEGLIVRHASAPAFLAMKWAAFDDRGRGDPFGSHDLEDILALVVSRADLLEEIRESPVEIRRSLVTHFAWLNIISARDELLAGHLNNAYDPARMMDTAKVFVKTLAQASVEDPA